MTPRRALLVDMPTTVLMCAGSHLRNRIKESTRIEVARWLEQRSLRAFSSADIEPNLKLVACS